MRTSPRVAQAFFLPVIFLLGPPLTPLLPPIQAQLPAGVVDQVRLERIDAVVEAAIRDGQLPGAVVLVWHRGRTVYHKAFGRRAVVPDAERMTTDTIFDLASLTKVVATTTAVMMLVEEGRIRLRAPVAQYVPGFDRHGKHDVTVEHLLTHMSGLRPDLDLDEEFDGYEIAISRAIEQPLEAQAGDRFIYSDINFFILGDIVARVSGMPLDRFAAQRIFAPLGMHSTAFKPGRDLRSRIAPTEACRPLGWPCGDAGATMLRGTVHDPTARRMGGVAGHAGVFGTAADLARFGAALISGGSLEGVRLLAPLTVARMTSPATPPGIRDRRGLGWDIDSRYSANRGDLFPAGSYGHTGFTGTSIWIDPSTRTVVVFLSSRLHPDGGGDVTALRGRVATLATAAITGAPVDTRSARDHRETEVETGIDVLRDNRFARLRGARVGLMTNQTGRARDGTTTIDLLAASPMVDLRALFSPEHGLRGDVDSAVADATDPETGLPIYSLYGDTRRPTPQMLDSLDTIVIDLQDVGVRFYTYATTMAYLMEAAADDGLRVIVLDRPNPITGRVVEGPHLDDAAFGFTGYFSMPVRHGLTIGELARLFNDEMDIGAALEVVSLRGWRRDLWFDESGLTWVNPSPNLRTLTQAVLYPGIGAIEDLNLSVGRGTDTPFEQIGAPWVDGVALAAALNVRRLPGVRVYPVSFTPQSSKYVGERCHGVHLIVTDRDALRPVRLGLEIAAALHHLHPEQVDLDAAARLLGSREALTRIRAGDDPATIAEDWVKGERAWQTRREPYLLYEP